MKWNVLMTLLVCLCGSLGAQDLTENNNAEAKAEAGVKVETGYYKHAPDTICLVWVKEFDQRGRLTRYIDHWQCGKIYSVYEYEYNDKTAVKSTITSHRRGFQPMTPLHLRDSRGRVVLRSFSGELPDPTYFEKLSYDAEGNVTRIEHHKVEAGEDRIVYEKDWTGTKEYTTNPEQEIYDDDGNLRWVLIREFEFY